MSSSTSWESVCCITLSFTETFVTSPSKPVTDITAGYPFAFPSLVVFIAIGEMLEKVAIVAVARVAGSA